jgi:hypothetical protein
LPALALILFTAAAGMAGESRAQFQRALPANGVLGVLRADPGLPLPLMNIDGKMYRLAPGGIIVDQNNRTLLHAQIPEQAVALIVFDSNGDVQRMFLLTADELQRVRAR